METNQLFVYGTLLQKIENYASHFLKNNCTVIGAGFITGVLYDIGHYPGAIYAAESQEKVFGEVVLLSNQVEVIGVLDEYEGFEPASPEKSEYIRIEVPVQMNEKIIRTWMYHYNFPIAGYQKIEHGNYLDYLGSKQ